jgi:hypothetical protein
MARDDPAFVRGDRRHHADERRCPGRRGRDCHVAAARRAANRGRRRAVRSRLAGASRPRTRRHAGTAAGASSCRRDARNCVAAACAAPPIGDRVRIEQRGDRVDDDVCSGASRCHHLGRRAGLHRVTRLCRTSGCRARPSSAARRPPDGAACRKPADARNASCATRSACGRAYRVRRRATLKAAHPAKRVRAGLTRLGRRPHHDGSSWRHLQTSSS